MNVLRGGRQLARITDINQVHIGCGPGEFGTLPGVDVKATRHGGS
jgi:hypothetical protein